MIWSSLQTLQRLLWVGLLLFPFEIVFAANDSTQLSAPLLNQGMCVKGYTETNPIPSGQSSVQFANFNISKLCPGTYVLYATCLVSSGSGCISSRCAWSGHLYMGDYSEYAPFFVSTTDCVARDKRMCENDTAIFYFTPVSLVVPQDAASQPGTWQIDLSVEKLGSYQSCTVSAVLTAS